MLKTLPDSDNKEKVEANLIEIAEDKYQELIDSGMEAEEVRRQVLESVCSIDDIREALGVDEKEKTYNEARRNSNKKLSYYVSYLCLMPVTFFAVDYIFGNETISNVVFLMAVLGMGYFFYKICSLLIKREKSKKDIEGYVEIKIRKVRNSIIGIACFLFFICAAVDAPEYFVFLLLGVSFGSYKGIKYLIEKKNL
jgi:cation transport ATPase